MNVLVSNSLSQSLTTHSSQHSHFSYARVFSFLSNLLIKRNDTLAGGLTSLDTNTELSMVHLFVDARASMYIIHPGQGAKYVYLTY